jgi:hypothetical protein
MVVFVQVCSSPKDVIQYRESTEIHQPQLFLFIPVDSYGFLRIPMDSYGFKWIPMDSYGYYYRFRSLLYEFL